MTEEKIIEEILALPGIFDVNGNLKSKIKIADYYCWTYEYTIRTIRNKTHVDDRGRQWTSFNDFDYPYIESVILDPMSFQARRREKYKRDFPLKITEEKREFNVQLFEKVKAIIVMKYI